MISAGLYIICTLLQTLTLLFILIGCIMVVTVGVFQDSKRLEAEIENVLDRRENIVSNNKKEN